MDELSKPILSKMQLLEKNLILLKEDLKQSEDHLALASKKYKVSPQCKHLPR